MKFKEWLVLSETTENPQDIHSAFLAYKSAPEDKTARDNFYLKLIRFVKMWCNKRKCVKRGILLDDLVSAVYTKLIEKIEESEGKFLTNLETDRFGSYLATVTAHALVDLIRAKESQKAGGRDISLTSDENDEGNSLSKIIVSRDKSEEEKAIRDEDNDIVRKIISELSEMDREIFDLFYNKEMKQNEIAEKLRVPIGTVKSRIFRLQAKVKQALENKESL